LAPSVEIPAVASLNEAAPQRPTDDVEGGLVLGFPERSDGIGERIPLYLAAKQDLFRVALTFALGDQRSQLRFVPTASAPPSLAQDNQLGAVTAAWLDGLTVRAGERLLLGYVEAPGETPANLQLYGVSASALDDNRPVLLSGPALTGPRR
jgi:hypothetical protein